MTNNENRLDVRLMPRCSADATEFNYRTAKLGVNPMDTSLLATRFLKGFLD